MIDRATIDKIMDAVQIVDVISDYVSLKKRGANYIGCCPFHNEKTPSFYVSQTKGIYKCFGCGESGNAVGFLMKHEHYTYPEALRFLANRYHIEIVEEEQTPEQKERQTERDGLFHVSEFAQKYFADLLYNDPMGQAIGLSYFHGRGLSDEIIKRFGLGYCKEEWTDFTDHARRNGYSDSVLEKTGLTIFKEDGKCFDRFKGRVAFPIFSVSGRVLGFSCRILTNDKKLAKYVNSPDSEIYNKSNILYGLYQARGAIGKADKCYLVEGNVDVVSMHQSGVENTVASCGTSLTVNQVRLIKRYTSNVTVLYDGDAAGIKATLKAVNLLFAEGLHVRMVLFPDGHDPDSYAQKYGSDQLQRYLQEHEENFLMYRAHLAGEGIRQDPTNKSRYVGEIAASIALVADPLERTEYITQCAYIFQTSEQQLSNMVARVMASARQKAYDEAQAAEKKADANEERKTDNAATSTQGVGMPTPPDDLFLPGDESPDANAQAAQYTVATQVAPHQELPLDNPAAAQEQQIARLLVVNGSNLINKMDIDSEGNQVIYEFRVADYLVAAIVNDELTFDDPMCQKVFDLYRQAVCDNQPLPDANYFARCDDAQLRNFALSQMMSPYEVSEKWGDDDHRILVPKPEERVDMDVEESLKTFQIKKLDQQIAQVTRKIKSCESEGNIDDMLIAVSEKNEMQKKRRQLGEALHRIIG
ncbi:MAG: DNA primase [Bacteroidales bacterium]|nr:DNA primase [Candidatus Colimorpha onthohippi]